MYSGQGMCGDNLVRIVYYRGYVYVVDVLHGARYKRYVHVTRGLQPTVAEGMYLRRYYRN